MKKYQFDETAVQEAWNTIEAASTITLLAHLRPDGDSLGACSALSRVLALSGKAIEIIYPSSTSDPFPFDVPELSMGIHTRIPDLLICCDIASDQRAYAPTAFNGVPRIIIDHHLNNTMEGRHRFVATEASSTCEIVYKLLTAWGQNITPEVADLLLFGMLCDTLHFRTPNTSAETLQIAGNLLSHGADLAGLNQKMIVHQDPRTLMLWGELLTNIQYTPDNNAVWALCTQRMLRTYECNETALTGFIDLLSRTITADVTMLFVELHDGTSKASLRGKTRDVRSIAAQLGGGGHTLAAGVSSQGPVSDLMHAVVNAL